jgi:hypothetical protein
MVGENYVNEFAGNLDDLVEKTKPPQMFGPLGALK